MKKNLLLSLFVSTVVVSSASANISSACFDGFYLGAGLNYSKEKFNTRLAFTAPGANQEGSSTPSLSGVGIKLFGGYGAVVYQGLYLGGELTLGYDRLINGSKGNNLKSNKKLNYGAAVRLGYVMSNVLPYLKFGYEGRPSVNLDTFSIRRSGFILGGGVDVNVTRNVFIRGEYVHGFGAKSNISGNVIINGVAGTGTLRVKTSSDTFLLGAGYRF